MAARPQSQPDPLAWAKVPDVTGAEGFAVKGLYAGTATGEQQQLAVRFIERMTCVDQPSFVLDAHGGDRATSYVEGRKSVGYALRVIRDLPADKLRTKDE